MTRFFDRTAALLAPRLWYAKVAGVLVWGAWVFSLVFGGSTFDATVSSVERGIAFQFGGTIATGDKPRDLIGQLVGMDHMAFYSPARMIREGRDADIYDPGHLHAHQRSLLPPGMWENEYEQYRNPPFYALLYYPTAGLSYAASVYVWTAVGLAGFVAGMYWLGAARPWVAAGWGLTFLPVFSAVSYGQNSLLSFTVLCATYHLLAGGHRFAAGMVAGLLWFKPPLLLGLVIWGLIDIRRLWPCAVGAVITGVALTLGTYPIIPGAWHGFAQFLFDNVTFGGFDQWKMHNPRAFWRLLLGGPGRLPELLWLVSAAAGVWLFVRVWRRNRDHLPTPFAASTFLMLWASPHTMVYEWTLAVVPAVLLWTHVPDRRAAWVVLFAVAWVAMFVSTDWSRAQVRLQEWSGWQPVVVVQVSVPLLAWVGWKAASLLTDRTTPDRGPTEPRLAGGLHGSANTSPAESPASAP